MEDFDS